MLRVQRNQLGSSSLPPAHADGAEQRTPLVRFATRYRLIGSAELAACVRVTEIADDGSRDINPVGELMFRALPFCLGASPSGGRFEGRTSVPAHKRNPPQKALAFSPARHRRGRLLSSLTLPPPITVSSGCKAAMNSSTNVDHMTPPLLFTVAL